MTTSGPYSSRNRLGLVGAEVEVRDLHRPHIHLAGHEIPHAESAAGLPHRQIEGCGEDHIVRLRLVPRLDTCVISVPEVVHELFDARHPFGSAQFREIAFGHLTHAVFHLFKRGPAKLVFDCVPQHGGDVAEHFRVVSGGIQVQVEQAFAIIDGSVEIEYAHTFCFYSVIPCLRLISVSRRKRKYAVNFT